MLFIVLYLLLVRIPHLKEGIRLKGPYLGNGQQHRPGKLGDSSDGGGNKDTFLATGLIDTELYDEFFAQNNELDSVFDFLDEIGRVYEVANLLESKVLAGRGFFPIFVLVSWLLLSFLLLPDR